MSLFKFDPDKEPFPVAPPRRWINPEKGLWFLCGGIPFHGKSHNCHGLEENHEQQMSMALEYGFSKEKIMLLLNGFLEQERAHGIDVPIPLPEDWATPQLPEPVHITFKNGASWTIVGSRSYGKLTGSNQPQEWEWLLADDECA